LPEVLVALTILSCISVVVFQVLARVGNGNYQELQQEAIRQANNRILDEPPERVFKDTLSMPPITVMVTQDSIPGTPLWLRRVEVKNQEGKRLCYRERIVK
jgi:hypothetical protein